MTRKPGVSCVTRSPRRILFAVRLTLFVSVSSTPSDGSKRHVSACTHIGSTAMLPYAPLRTIRDAQDRRVRRARPLDAQETLACSLVPVIAIIGSDIGSACLVEQHQH